MEFVAAIESGNLDRAKELHEKHGVEIETSNIYQSGKAFLLACKKGHLEAVKWLYWLDDVAYTYMSKAFVVAASDGQIEIIKWISETLENRIYTGDIMFAFGNACSECKWEVMQYLMQKYQDQDIDYYIEIQKVLEYAIETDKVIIVKFIFETMPEFLELDNLHICLICNSVSCIKWILAAYQFEKKTIERLIEYGEERDNYPTEVLELLKKELVWTEKKYPLWLASDLTPCKNNLLYRIPEDVSRYIIETML